MILKKYKKYCNFKFDNKIKNKYVNTFKVYHGDLFKFALLPSLSIQIHK